MKLIYSNASPYARTVRVALRELEMLERMEEIAQHPFDNPAQLISFNPLCKVPCLINEDGKGIFDSQVICEYLDSKANNQLFSDINQNWQLKTYYSLTRGILDSCVAWQQDKMRGKIGESEFWQSRFISSIERGLDFLRKKINELPKEVSALTINLVTILDYLDFRHPEYDWQERHPELIDWYQIWSKRESFDATKPKA